MRDAEQPGRDAAPGRVVAASPAPHVEEGVLCNLFSLASVAEHMHGQRIDGLE